MRSFNCPSRTDFLKKILLLSTMFFSLLQAVHAQSPGRQQEGPVNLKNYLLEASDRLNMVFYFRNEWIDTIQVAQGRSNSDLAEILSVIRENGLEPIPYSDWQFILIWRENTAVYEDYEITGVFNREVQLSGNIKQLNSEEVLPGATVTIDELDTGTVTDNNGRYTIRIPSGTYHIRSASVGLEEEVFLLSLTNDTTLNFELADKVITLGEVTISDERIDQNVSEVTSGMVQMDMLTIRGLPAFMGEADVVRSLLMMPGVSSVGEGASGFNVRGGAVDQNLVMIDHTPVFNSSHLFGLFSVFNQDLVKDVTLYKGTIPARYGGRLSSVLDVATREEVTPKITGRGGIGLISNRLTLDIPLVKEKMSVTVGGRGAFNDFLLKLVPDPQISNSSAWFYDINLKYNYNLDEKNIIRGSYYRSADQFRLPNDTAYFWGTDNLSLQWKHLFGENLVGNFTLAYSKFRYGVEGKAENMGYEWRAGIEYRNIMADFNWLYPEKHQIGFGGSIIHYFFNSGDLIPYSGSSLNPVTIEDDQAYETAIYLEDEYSISERFSLMGGLRFSYYQAVGPSTVTIYEEGQPLRPSTVVSTRSFSSGEVIKSYSGWEPRIGIRIGLSARSSIKLSWNRMYQYIHLVSNSTAVTPVDTWYPSNLYILPENADQYSIGFFRNFLENTIETSIEIFYKDIFNLLDYKDGATLLLNDFIEEELLQGRGRAYGLEFLFRKKIGRLTGWLAYTWSRTEMKMESSFEEETINFGNYYPASFDHPNNLSITTSYRFTRRWSMSANFVYMTGRPGTFPDSKYVVDHFAVAGYGERNLDRIPDYHRFDISFTLDGNLKKNKKWDGSWTFSIYNLFNRNNAYSVFFRSEFGSIPQAYKLSVLGATFPAITYNFKF